MNLKDNMNTSADNSLLLGGGKGRGLSAVLFPGSFDPFTKGHADIVRRALLMFDEVVIGVGYNGNKAGAASPEERVEKIGKLYADNPRVRVESYSGLTADFAKANETLQAFRCWLVCFCEAFDVPVVDFAQDYVNRKDLYLDGLHPNAEGYRRIARYFE